MAQQTRTTWRVFEHSAKQCDSLSAKSFSSMSFFATHTLRHAVSSCRGKEGHLLGMLLLLLLFCISFKFDPDGVPFQRCSKILAPLIVGAFLWACFHALVSFVLSTTLSRKLESLYNRSEIPKSRSLDAQRCEFLNRIVSLAHAVFSFLSAVVVLSKGFGIGLRNTELQSQVLMFSATYFVFDYGYVTYHRIGDFLDMLHHVIAVGGLLSTLLLDQCGGEVVCAIVVTEVSNPFLHTRKLLQILQLHKRHPLFFKSNNYLFALSYLMGRMVFGGWFVYRTITSSDSPVMMKAASLAMLVLSAIWFKRILEVARAPPDSKRAQL